VLKLLLAYGALSILPEPRASQMTGFTSQLMKMSRLNLIDVRQNIGCANKKPHDATHPRQT